MKVPNVAAVPRELKRWVLGAVVLGASVAGTSQAGAQTVSAPTDIATPGKLLVEKIENEWLLSPDVRAAELGGRTGTLAGGYVGRITDRTLVFGGGGYWLTNRAADFKLAYGGGVVEWLARSDRKIGFGVRTLIGAGSATLPRTLGEIVNLDANADRRSRGARFGVRTADPATRIAVRDEFFILEPQLSLLWNMTNRYRVSFGLGYRAIGLAPWLGDQLQGASGSVSIQIGGGS